MLQAAAAVVGAVGAAVVGAVGAAVVGGWVGGALVGGGGTVMTVGGTAVVGGTVVVGRAVVVGGAVVDGGSVDVVGGWVGTATLLPLLSSPPSATKATRPIAHNTITDPAVTRAAVTSCMPLRVP